MSNISLSNLFSAIHKSVSEATSVARNHAAEYIKEDYFEEEKDENGKPTGFLIPKMLKMKLPVLLDGKLTNTEFDIPLYSLAKHNALCMDELKISMNVDLREVKEDVMINLASRWLGEPTKAKVEITFKGQDCPEGVMKINDRLVKTIP